MKKTYIYILKILNSLYMKVFDVPAMEKLHCEKDADKVSEVIYNRLMDDKPCMIARFGSTELATIVNYLGVTGRKKSVFGYITGKTLPWWWNESIMQQMQQWSGFFPPTQEKIEQFSELMLQDMKEVDVLGSWLVQEHYFANRLFGSVFVNLELLSPYFSRIPWTKALAGKKILVIHPFAVQIEQQYQKRELLFANPDILPDFQLLTITAVQSLGGESNGFNDWFAALNWMKAEMDKVDYEVCLIGAGAYGFPLAAHAKRSGKKAVHMGGVLQLLFGIKGKRWENPNYNKDHNYTTLMNEHWVRPNNNGKPKNAETVEGACYW